MEYLRYTAIGLSLLCEIIILFIALLSRTPFKILLVNSAIGIACLAAVNILGIFTNVTIPINEWTSGGTALFGMPAVIGFLLLKFIMV